MIKHVIILKSFLFVFVTTFQPFVLQYRVEKDASIQHESCCLSTCCGRLIQNSRLKNAEQEASSPETRSEYPGKEPIQRTATVVRLAARKFNENASKPSSRNYTTRKDSRESITVTLDGVKDDYNHYRTIALQSTRDRALSILTTDVMSALQRTFSSCQNGDLGENVLLDGMAFNEIQIGQYYTFGSTRSSSVVIEVTEPMIPCANLCKLFYINDKQLAPKERVAKCVALLEFLEKPGDGFRGWYAKVIEPGEIHVGDEFRAMNE